MMGKRAFENTRWFVMAVLIAVAMIVFAGAYRAMAGPEDAPLAALYAVTWEDALITADENTSGYTTQNYAYHDIFCAVDALDAQSITITDTQVFTRVLSYGRYERLKFDVRTSAAITPACKSVFFNNWYPSEYAQMKGPTNQCSAGP